MNPLFRATERAIREAVAEEFRATRLGQLAEALGGGAKRSPTALRRIVREIGSTSRDMARRVGSVSRFSFLGDMTSSVINSMRAFLSPISNLLRGLVEDWRLSTGGFGGRSSQPPRGAGTAAPGGASGGRGNQPPTGTTAPAGGSFDDEIQSAIRFLEANGYTVIPPGQQPPTRPPRPTEPQRPEDLGFTQEPPTTRGPTGPRGPLQPGQRINIFGGGLEYDPDDPLFSGEMVPVESSNVHSIGFIFNPQNPSKGTLKVRFLQQSKSKNRKVAGPLYFYYDVHPLVFQAFRNAGSPGGFVWDRLRVRGTVSGHRFHYELKGIAEGYVPRKATRYGNEEYFIGRRATFRNQQTGELRMFESELPDVHVQTLMPPRFGPQGFVPPNRGRPNRGRP